MNIPLKRQTISPDCTDRIWYWRVSKKLRKQRQEAFERYLKEEYGQEAVDSYRLKKDLRR